MKKESVGRERNTDEAIQLVLACIIFPIHIDYKKFRIKIVTNSICFVDRILIEIIEEFCSHLLQKFRLENLKKESVGSERNTDEAIQLVLACITFPIYIDYKLDK